jgi:hypothetical protein
MDTLVNEVKDDIAFHYQKWPLPAGKSFDSDIAVRYYFLEKRNDYIRGYLASWFDLQGSNILHISKPAHGTVYIDGIKLDKNFNGEYFDNAKVTLKAIPDAGYKFTGWSNADTRQSIEITLNSDITLSAQFEKTTTPKIVINEINYKSDKNHDSGDWVELVNNDVNAIDISNWVIKDDSISSGFTIPANTILQPGAYLVLCEDTTKFSSQYNTQAPVLGNLPFGLSKSEDTIHLYNEQGALVDQVHYDKTWSDAKGNGKTLSLIDPDSDNSLSTNWIAADNFGTPGESN